MNRLNPEPGEYLLPMMRLARVMGSDRPDVIQLVFETDAADQGQTKTLTISAPISTLDAAGLLRSLRMLQARGLVPIVSEPTSQSKTS